MTPINATWLFFSEVTALAHHFVVPHPPPPSHSVAVLVVLATLVSKYRKWQAIQLAIHSTIGAYVDIVYINNYRIVANFIQASVFLLDIVIVHQKVAFFESSHIFVSAYNAMS